MPFTRLNFKSLIIALCSGVLMGLAPAPFNVWYLAWLALAPLWFLIRTQKTLQQIAILSLGWGIGYHGLALFWILFLIHMYFIQYKCNNIITSIMSQRIE